MARQPKRARRKFRSAQNTPQSGTPTKGAHRKPRQGGNVRHNDVYPNATWFSDFAHHNGGEAHAANIMGVTSDWYSLCLSGNELVSRGAMIKAVSVASVNLKKAISFHEVVTRPHSLNLSLTTAGHNVSIFPESGGSKRQLHGYYMDYNRSIGIQEKKPVWWREDITLSKRSECDVKGGLASFDVSIENISHHKARFSGRADLLSPRDLVIRAVRTADAKSHEIDSLVIHYTERILVAPDPSREDSYTVRGIYTTQDQGKRVCVGTWNGTDSADLNARVYRNMLCDQPLTLAELNAIGRRSLELFQESDVLIEK